VSQPTALVRQSLARAGGYQCAAVIHIANGRAGRADRARTAQDGAAASREPVHGAGSETESPSPGPGVDLRHVGVPSREAAAGIRDSTLPQLFRDEIEKSWLEYVEQVGKDMAESTPFWTDALNEILAGGKKLF
jgi:hypothetical protein